MAPANKNGPTHAEPTASETVRPPVCWHPKHAQKLYVAFCLMMWSIHRCVARSVRGGDTESQIGSATCSWSHSFMLADGFLVATGNYPTRHAELSKLFSREAKATEAKRTWWTA